jgi:hypothetical protein
MPPFARSALAVVTGAAVSIALIAAVEATSNLLYPLPAGLDVSNREAMSSYVATLPVGAFLLVLTAYAVGGLGGGYLAARLAPAAPVKHAAVIASLLLAASVMNLMAIPHPGWFWAANLVVALGLPLLGGRLRFGPPRS